MTLPMVLLVIYCSGVMALFMAFTFIILTATKDPDPYDILVAALLTVFWPVFALLVLLVTVYASVKNKLSFIEEPNEIK